MARAVGSDVNDSNRVQFSNAQSPLVKKLLNNRSSNLANVKDLI